MNTLKIIILLIIGAILGYSFSFIGKADNNEHFNHENVALSKVPLFKTEPKEKSKIKNKQQNIMANTPPAAISSNCKDSKYNNIEVSQKHLDLVETHQTLKQEYHKSLSKISTLKRQLGELDESEVTDEEMESLVPAPFKSFLSSFRGETRNDIFDFHNKEDDFDWGYDKQNNISDYIQTHFEGVNVELISVICKQPRCEILVTEKHENAWDNIMKDMTQQLWWKFSSFTSSTRSNAENELSIYVFFSQ